jgi:hypothetical protein
MTTYLSGWRGSPYPWATSWPREMVVTLPICIREPATGHILFETERPLASVSRRSLAAADRTHLRAPRSAGPLTLDSPANGHVPATDRGCRRLSFQAERSPRETVGNSEERGITLQPQIPPCFTIPDVWSGGYYELELYLGPPSEANIRAALHAVWQRPALEGPFADRDKEPSDQAIVATDAERDGLFGFTQIRGVRIPCRTSVVRLEDDNGTRIDDFVSICYPMSGLSLVFDVGSFPFGSIKAVPDWRATMDAWFLQLLKKQRGAFTFEVGVIGFETDLTDDNIAAYKAGAIPPERCDGIVVFREGEIEWYPPTQHDLITLYPRRPST